MSDVFISYASSTEAQARRVADAVRALGYQVWRDEQLPPHRAYAEVIEERLRAAKAVVVVWSKDAAHSQWVRAEADVARNEAKLVQLVVDETTPPLPFNQIQCAKLAGWRGETSHPEWRKVAASLTELMGAPDAAVPDVRHQNVRARFRASPRAIAGIAAVVVAGIGLWAMRDHLPFAPGPVATSVAVLPFDTLGPSQDVRTFADGLLDEILGALSNDQVQAVSRTEGAALRAPNARAAAGQLGVGLLLDGSVGEANGVINVRVHLDDPAQHAIIWSEDFERPAAAAESLQAEVAAKATHVAADAIEARAAGVTEAATLADFVTAKERIHFDWSNGTQAAEPLLRRVIARAPRFAGGHAYLAESLAVQSFAPGDPRAADQRAEAEREAHQALALDPKGYGAFHPLAELRPISDIRGREALMQKALALNPTDAGYLYFEGEILAFTGRMKAAAETARRAVGADPLWPGPTRDLGFWLLETGHTGEGLQTFERMARLWPRHYATLSGRFWANALYGEPGAALALLDSPDTRPPDIDATGADLWRGFLNAVKSGQADARARAVAALTAAVDRGQWAPGPAMVLLARLGATDVAYRIADKHAEQIGQDYGLGAPYFFVSQTASVRRNPRFMALAARLGMVDYWRSTGHWPDFCSESGLPYNCKAVAAQLTR